MSPENSSDRESPLSSSTRRKPSGVDKRYTDSKHEEDDGDTLGGQSSVEEGGETIDEEHKNGKEIGTNVPSTAKYWKSFRKVLDDIEETEYGSIDDWYRDALQVLGRHKEKLDSMSKD